MKPKIYSTKDSMFELDNIFCGKTNEIQVYEDCNTRLFEKKDLQNSKRTQKSNKIAQIR